MECVTKMPIAADSNSISVPQNQISFKKVADIAFYLSSSKLKPFESMKVPIRMVVIYVNVILVTMVMVNINAEI